LARQLFDIGIFNALSSAGALGAGWKLAFYTATTTTPITTYNAASFRRPRSAHPHGGPSLAQILMVAQLRIIDESNVDRLITEIIIADGSGTDRTITQGRIIDAMGVDRVFFDPGGASSFVVNLDFANRYGFSNTGTITTNTVTATPSGGTGPYTYAWTLISHDGPVNPTATSAATAATAFTQTGVGPGEIYSAVFRCTVTDSLAATATADCTAHFADIT
jgi:hypothetical protein